VDLNPGPQTSSGFQIAVTLETYSNDAGTPALSMKNTGWLLWFQRIFIAIEEY
jgi:hypothetical protein